MERLELYKGLPNPRVRGLVGRWLAEAKKPFETYMTLAPTGKYAEQVKGLLPLIK